MSKKNIYLKAASEQNKNTAKTRKYPIITVVSEMKDDKVFYSLSVCSPSDDFVKRVGAEMASKQPLMMGKTSAWTDEMVEKYGMNKAVSLAILANIKCNMPEGMPFGFHKVIDDNLTMFYGKYHPETSLVDYCYNALEDSKKKETAQEILSLTDQLKVLSQRITDLSKNI